MLSPLLPYRSYNNYKCAGANNSDYKTIEIKPADTAVSKKIHYKTSEDCADYTYNYIPHEPAAFSHKHRGYPAHYCAKNNPDNDTHIIERVSPPV